MDLRELEEHWSSVSPPLGGDSVSGKRIPGLPVDAPVYAALDSEGVRHVVVPLKAGDPPVTLRATRGLEVATESLKIGDGLARSCVDIRCRVQDQFETFNHLALDLIGRVGRRPSDPGSAVVACIERWRAFWSVPVDGLGRDAAIGLFGELWFLDRWYRLPFFESVVAWTGPRGSRHDFQSDRASIEVKTSARGGPLVHTISSIDQLEDAEKGQLYLFSLHVREDELAGNTLPGIVQRVAAKAAGDPVSSLRFDECLAASGYNPAHAGRYRAGYRIVSEELFKVEGAFPRLTRRSFAAGLPNGVEAVTYGLGMAACRPWRVAVRPEEMQF